MENAFFLPIFPGKTEAAYAFAEALSTSRHDEMSRSQVSVTKESWFIQDTPHGSFLIMYFQSADGEQVNANLTASTEPFDLWFKAQLMDITGIDCNQKLPTLPKQVLNWSK